MVAALKFEICQNCQNLPGAPVNFYIQFFLENRSVLGVIFFSAYNTSTGASKYIKIVKIHYPPNFQNFPKLCISFKNILNNNGKREVIKTQICLSIYLPKNVMYMIKM